VRRLCSVGLACLLTLGALSACAQSPKETKAAGAPRTAQGRAGDAPAKVAILVIPESADSARVALTYSGKVERKRVQQEIANLARFAGGRLAGKVEIRDYSLNPNNLRHFPVTTSAEFQLVQSPQFQDAEPRVLPYLQAFRKWGSLDVLFNLPGATESAGAMQFQSEPMSAWLFRDNGVYRVHAEIARGEAALPIPAFVPESAPPAVVPSGSGALSAAERTTASEPSSWPMMLIIAGGGLACGAGLYLLAARRSASKVSVHPQ
jgi:hypothetical protein